MNALSNTAALPAASFVKHAVARELYIELVPGAGGGNNESWRERLAAGLAPSMYYSVACDIPAGDQIVRAEFNIQATDELGRLFPIRDAAGQTLTTGEFTLCPLSEQRNFAATEPGGEVTKSRRGGADITHVKLRPDGEAAVLVELPPGWSAGNVLKSIAHRISGKTFLLEDVSLTYSGKVSSGGHPFAKARVGSFSIVDAPAGLQPVGEPIAAPKFAAAARRTSTATTAVLP